MNFNRLRSTMALLSGRRDLGDSPDPLDEAKRRKKKKSKTKHVVYSAFPPVFYPGHMGTPKSGQPYLAQPGAMDAAGGSPPPSGGAGPAPMGASWSPPSRLRVFHEMKKAMGLLEFSGASGGAAVTWTGFAVPNPLSVKNRQGGPTIGGPGFTHDQDGGGGGVYEPRKSPGLGFKTDGAWKVWNTALDIMDKDKTLPPMAILQAAFQRSGVKVPTMDPAEARLIQMGIEWYLSSPTPYAAQRDGSGGGQNIQPGKLGGAS